MLVSLFDSCNNLAPIELLHFFLRTLLPTTILLCIKSKHPWYAYIPGNQLLSGDYWRLTTELLSLMAVMLEVLRHMHICTRSIQIYFRIFFHFICVSPSFHCSHAIPIFSEIFPIFLPILFTSKACHFDMALLILLLFKRPGRHSH